MSDGAITIIYDGGDASQNAIDAKLYGQSLQGLDRMVSDCLIIVTEERLPKRGDRAGLVLKVKEAEAGSFTSPAFYQELSDVLSVGVPVLQAIGPEIVGYYVGAVLDRFRGEDSAVELAITKMAEMHQQTVEGMDQMHRDSLNALDRKDERQHIEHMGMQELLRRAIDGSGPAAKDYVAPVGRSVDKATFLSGAAPAVRSLMRRGMLRWIGVWPGWRIVRWPARLRARSGWWSLPERLSAASGGIMNRW